MEHADHLPFAQRIPGLYPLCAHRSCGMLGRLIEFGDSLGQPVKYVALVDYSNSRGASDMGVLPDLLPGYRSVRDADLEPGWNFDQILAAPDQTLGVSRSARAISFWLPPRIG